MSNALAVSAVTSTLRNLLDLGSRDNPAGTVVTTHPPDRARAAVTGNQLNLFMYHTSVDAAWRNMDVPGRVGLGEPGLPPLPLVLDYLITAYGENDDETVAHRVLGRAMGVLHDHPVLSADDVRLAFTAADLAEIDLQDQVERIRMSYLPMTLEEMSKLWTAFQTQYRVSAAYRVSVVLIESTRPRRSALPVLRQGERDDGPSADPRLIPPFPTLTGVDVPGPEGGVQLGDGLALRGHHLAGDAVEVRLRTHLLDAAIVVPPDAAPTDTRIGLTLPGGAAAASAWPAGLYTVEVEVRRDVPDPDGGPGSVTVTRTTNRLPLWLAPRVTAIVPTPVVRDPNGDVTLTATLEPLVRDGQRVVLLFGDAEITPQVPAPPPVPGPPAPTGSFTFTVRAPAPGAYLVRIRVDGVDSPLAVRTPAGLRFDEAMRVRVP